ncbi:MAG TPA: GHKL domain-containing protein [Candidatus Anaerobutyricum stercoripullorum]|uniref:GHKL domain-containing protein n=1 Tax=Candidatus Anaerobutyricum stercoripullorum TaxID=2838456 RepID=A0A9D2BEF8_9FIRM|nr:GHKL domain-containing protein [Candidatus Anaerobutyricum stercoripullorum]
METIREIARLLEDIPFTMWLLLIINVAFIVGSMRNLFRIKKGWRGFLPVIAVAFLASGTVVYIGDWGNLPLTFVVILVLIWVCSEDDGWKKMTVGLLFGSTIFAWNALVDNFIRIHSNYFLLPRVLFAVLFFAATRRFAAGKDYDLTPKMWRLVLLLTFVPVGNVLSVVLLSEERWEIGETDLRLHFAVLCLAFVAFVGLLWAIRVLARQRRLEQEALSAKLNEAYYESMEQQHFELRRLRHDMANHLQALSALPSEKKDTYIQELLDNGALAKTLNYCGDPTINAVLSVKENLLRQQNISLELKLDIPEELPFEKADLCAIYANALDNAAEACDGLPEEKPETTNAEPRANNTKNRTIILESRARKGMLVFQITNPVPENVQGQYAGISVQTETFSALSAGKEKSGQAETLPPTTKKDRTRHGYGLRSIRTSVEKYGGHMEIRQEEGQFTLFGYLPMHSATPQQKNN